MKKYSKKPVSSALVLIIPLVIALVVVLSAKVLTGTKTNTESKAEFNPTAECLASCDNRMVKDKAACKLDCGPVIAGTMTCDTFCKENVKPVTSQTLYNSKSTVGECKKLCAKWTADPCRTSTGGICGGSVKMGNAVACQSACNEGKDEEKTCAEAFVPAAFSENDQSIDVYKMRCIAVFE